MNFIKKNFTIRLFLIIFIFFIFLIDDIIINGQNITFGIGFGYTDFYNKNCTDLETYQITYQPAIGYEVFSYFSLPFIFNNFDLIFGIKLISKGFTYSDNKKFEIIYLQPIIKLRFLIFRNKYSKVFFDLGFDIGGFLIDKFILNYSNFSIIYDDNIYINQKDTSLELATGIIFNRLILSMNVYIQLNEVSDVNDVHFNNYSMFFTIGFIL